MDGNVWRIIGSTVTSSIGWKIGQYIRARSIESRQKYGIGVRRRFFRLLGQRITTTGRRLLLK